MFYDYLISIGVNDNHIIKLALDDIKNKKYSNPEELYNFVESKIADNDMYYIRLTECLLINKEVPGSFSFSSTIKGC